MWDPEKRREETKRSQEKRRLCDEGWAERLSWGKKESASSINVPVLLKLMAHSMKEKVLDAGDFQDWKHQAKVRISLHWKELQSYDPFCVTLLQTRTHIYRDGNKLCYCCCWSSVILSTTQKKVNERGYWLALGVSLEMRPWVCLNHPTVEQELEAKPKRPWITACERGGVCVKVKPWSMQMSLGSSDSSWI